MMRSLIKATAKRSIHLAQLNCQVLFFIFAAYVVMFVYLLISMILSQRGMHTRNKKAMELIAKGWSALKEVDRVIDYCELNDKRLIPLLRVMFTKISMCLDLSF